MKKVDMWTDIAYLFSSIAFILFAISEYENSPITSILLIIIQSYVFIYCADILIKRIRKKNAHLQATNTKPDVKEELDNWTITSFIVISLAFLVLAIIEGRDLPMLRFGIIVFESVIVLICTVERIKRAKAAKQNDGKA